jgi:creatinine amidohydrolase
MRIADMDWRMVEDWTRHDDRCVLPLGSTEQHAGLSLATDTILADRIATEAAEPLDIPVFRSSRSDLRLISAAFRAR